MGRFGGRRPQKVAEVKSETLKALCRVWAEWKEKSRPISKCPYKEGYGLEKLAKLKRWEAWAQANFDPRDDEAFFFVEDVTSNDHAFAVSVVDLSDDVAFVVAQNGFTILDA